MHKLPREFWQVINVCALNALIDKRAASEGGSTERKAEIDEQIAFFDKIRAIAYDFEHEENK